ncbi:hypothetical protein [Pelagicoccus sp. SDUM812003]|uniref:hypothetical protein n=1 Tax=Pelagicoccus sp. SDUM812003 TaxID=3041267 RepID=UPI00280F1749|nr:hypothetical protein [Pelagicoccus sp. SDUM812003]MDQ8202787.1 hypothetical protein [Pelagicoccus sp. SDUM812003]
MSKTREQNGQPAESESEDSLVGYLEKRNKNRFGGIPVEKGQLYPLKKYIDRKEEEKFDPDTYLAKKSGFDPSQPFTIEKESQPFDPFAQGLAIEDRSSNTGFDPDAYLSSKKPETGTFEGLAGSLNRGALQAEEGLRAAAIESDLGSFRGDDIPRLTAEREQLEAIDQAPLSWEDRFRQKVELARAKTLENAAIRGQERAGRNIDTQASRIAEIQDLKAKTAMTQAYRDYVEGEDWFAAFKRNPIEVSANLMLESLVGSSPTLAATIPASLAGPVGTAAAAGIGGGMQERSALMLELLQKDYQVDLSDPQQLKDAFTNPEIMADVTSRASQGGAIVGAAEGLSGGVAGKLVPGAGSGVKRLVGGVAADQAAQAAIEGGGEATKQLVVNDEIDGREVFSEVVGGRAADSVETALNVSQRVPDERRRAKIEQLRQENDQRIGEKPSAVRDNAPRELEFVDGSKGTFTPADPDADPFESSLSPEARQRVDEDRKLRNEKRLVQEYGLSPEELERTTEDAKARYLSMTPEEVKIERDLQAKRVEENRQAEQARLEAQIEQDRRRKLEQKERIRQERAEIKRLESEGVNADGQLDYELLDDDRLSTLANQDDEQAQREIMRREDERAYNREPGDEIQRRVAKAGKLLSPRKAQELFNDPLVGELQRLQKARPGLFSDSGRPLGTMLDILKNDDGFTQLSDEIGLIDALEESIGGREMFPDASDDVPFSASPQGDPMPDLQRAARQFASEGGSQIQFQEAQAQGNDQAAVANEARRLGLELRFFRRTDGQRSPVNGFYDPQSGRVWIEQGANRETAYQAILDHEWTHALERTDPESYRRLVDYFQQSAPKASEAAWLQYREDARRGGAPASKSLRESEGTAKLAELVSSSARGFKDDAYWTDLAISQPTLIDRIIDAVNRVLKRVSNRVQDKRINSELAKATLAFRRTLERAKANAAERSQNANTGDVQFAAAYHGSPHRFDRFTTAKIGTGEGMQSYGWGMYFAGNKEVAEYYKKALTEGRGLRARDVAARLLESLPDTMSLQEKEQSVIEELERRRDRSTNPEFIERMNSAIEATRNGLTGAFYTVDLKPSEDEYLLWDKQMTEQSDKVREALSIDTDTFSVEPDGRQWKVVNDRTGEIVSKGWNNKNTANRMASMGVSQKGEAYYATLAAKLGNEQRLGINRAKEAASKYLRSLGIRGIKFLDQGSRQDGEGSYNYVIFDDADVEITDIRFSRSSDRIQELRTRLDDLTRQIEELEAKGDAMTYRDTAKLRNLLGQRSEARVELIDAERFNDTDETTDAPTNEQETIDLITDPAIIRTGTATLEKEPSGKSILKDIYKVAWKGWRRFTELNEDPKWQRFKEQIADLERSGEIIREEVNRNIEYILDPVNRGREDVGADLQKDYQIISKRLQQAMNAGKSTADLQKKVTDAYNRMIEAPYRLFRQLVIFQDLKVRAAMVNPTTGKPLALPNKLTPEQVEKQLAALVKKLRNHKDRANVQEAMRRHYDAMEKDRQLLESFGYEIPPDQNNPYYYPHKVIEYEMSRLPQPKFLSDKPFRGYLQELTGSDKDIDSDYLQAVYSHMYEVRLHNQQQRTFEEGVKPYDIADKVLKQAQEREDREAAMQKRKARKFNRNMIREENLPEGYVKHALDINTPMRLADVIDREALAKELGVQISSEQPLMRQLFQMGVDAKLTPEMLSRALVASPKRIVVIPKELSQQIRTMIRQQDAPESFVGRTAKSFNRFWKFTKLFLPWNYIRYEYGNTLTDLEKLLSGDPRVYQLLGQAHREVVEFMKTGKGGVNVRQAFRNGVFDTVTQQEIEALPKLKAFENFTPSGEQWKGQLEDLWKGTAKISRYREALFRYAKFLSAVEAYENGAYPKYQGAYSKEVEAMTDTYQGAGDAMYRKAGKISRETFGDYGAIGYNGNQLRQHMIPFYSWIEINFRYHRNILRNYRDLMQNGRFEDAKGVRYHGAAMAAGFAARLLLPYLAIQMWNNSDEREELEKTLSEHDRRRLHIVLGKDDEGKTIVVYAPTALGDIAEWFGGNDMARIAGEMYRGEIDFAQGLESWMKGRPGDLGNKVLQSVGPVLKIPYTYLSKQYSFPDAFDQRSIPEYEILPVIIGQASDQFAVDLIRRIVDEDYYPIKDLGDWAQQLILQRRKRDPEQWAYYSIRDKANDFMSKHGKSFDPGVNNSEDAQLLRSFRKAIYDGDVRLASKFYLQLLDHGYTYERFQASLRSQNPLSFVPKRDGLRRKFVEDLTPWEREQLDLAFAYYAKIGDARGSERFLFPSNRKLQSRSAFEPELDRLRKVVDQQLENDREALAKRLLKQSL